MSIAPDARTPEVLIQVVVQGVWRRYMWRDVLEGAINDGTCGALTGES